MFYRDVLIESRERNAFMSKELQIRNSTVDFCFYTRCRRRRNRSQGSEYMGGLRRKQFRSFDVDRSDYKTSEQYF